MSASSKPTRVDSTGEKRQLIGKSPQEIRAALLPEEVGDFDREFRRVMDDAKERLDLTEINRCLERWWRVAMSSRDPEAHRYMLDVADRVQRGERVSTVSWSETKARLGL